MWLLTSLPYLPSFHIHLNSGQATLSRLNAWEGRRVCNVQAIVLDRSHEHIGEGS